MIEKEIIAELEEEQEIEAVIELEKLRGAQGYNTYELYLRNLSKDEAPMSEKEWLDSLSKTNYYKVYTQRYVDDYNRVTKYIPLKINAYNETCLINVAINGFHLLKDKDYKLLDYGELANEGSEYKYDLNENLRYISLNEPLNTMKHQQIDIEVYKTIVANSEDYEKLKGEGGGANGFAYENNLLQLTKNGIPVGEPVQIDSNSIFICGEGQTIDDAPEEAKIIIDSNIVNSSPINFFDMAFPVGKTEIFYDNEDHSDYLGFQWVRTAIGKMPIGIDEDDSDFNEIGKIGGEKEHILTVNEMPSHKHNLQWDKEGSVGSGNGTLIKDGTTSTSYVYSTGSKGGDQPHNNMPPYQVFAFWRRIG